MKNIIFAITLIAAAFGTMSVSAQNADAGKATFQQACASCHSLSSKKEGFHVGPPLYGVTKRPGRTDAWLLDWISDPEAVLKRDKDVEPLKTILKEYNNVPMPSMLKALNGGNLEKAKKATQDIIAFLKQNDSKPDTAKK